MMYEAVWKWKLFIANIEHRWISSLTGKSLSGKLLKSYMCTTETNRNELELWLISGWFVVR